MKFNLLLVVVTMLLTLGCGGSKAPSDNNETTASTPPPPSPVFRPETAEERIAAAARAGEYTALVYLAIQKPNQEQLQAIQTVCALISTNLTGYTAAGFSGALPGISLAVDKEFPKQEQLNTRILAKKVASDVLEALDNLFVKHPDWKVSGNESASAVGAFIRGVSATFANAIGALEVLKIDKPDVNSRPAPVVDEPKNKPIELQK